MKLTAAVIEEALSETGFWRLTETADQTEYAFPRLYAGDGAAVPGAIVACELPGNHEGPDRPGRAPL